MKFLREESNWREKKLKSKGKIDSLLNKLNSELQSLGYEAFINKNRYNQNNVTIFLTIYPIDKRDLDYFDDNSPDVAKEDLQLIMNVINKLGFKIYNSQTNIMNKFFRFTLSIKNVYDERFNNRSLQEAFGESEELNTFVYQAQRRFSEFFMVTIKENGKVQQNKFAFESAAKKMYNDTLADFKRNKKYHDGAQISWDKVTVTLDFDEQDSETIFDDEELPDRDIDTEE